MVKNAAGTYMCACGKADCGSAGKHPHGALAARGLTEATTDPAVIEAWGARAGAPINFGVTTAKLVVVDVDGAAGRDSLEALEEQHGALPRTWRASTGSGRSLRNGESYSMSGRHIYFKAPRGKDIRNSAGALAEGLDIRANGGYVVVPGSRHVTGVLYSWLPEYHPNNCALAPCPAWLLQALAEPKHNGARPIEVYRDLAAAMVGKGARNATVTRLAGHLLAGYASPDVVHELLQGWNLGRCKPPLPATEITRIVCSIAEAELRKRSGADG